MSVFPGLGLPIMMVSLLVELSGVALLVFALLRRRYRLAVFVLGIGSSWAAVYMALLVSTSLASRDVVLPAGEAKAFCGAYLDCHIHVGVDEVVAAETLGAGDRALRSRGRFLLVTLRVSSDAVSATLVPGPFDVSVVDAIGRRFPRSLAAERVLEQVEGPLGSLERPVAAGEAYIRRVVFDLGA